MSNYHTIRNTRHKHKTHTHANTRQWFSLEVKQKSNKSSHKRSQSKGSKCIANVKTLYTKLQVQEALSILLMHRLSGEKTK